MATDARAKILNELLAEFVEERVRQAPKKVFGLGVVTRALSGMLRDSDTRLDLKSTDDARLVQWLDQHPFLQRTRAGASAQWTPGLKKPVLKRA